MKTSEHGVVYTKRWVVEWILDMAGYRAGTGLADKLVVEPSCGCGAFLTVIAERLAEEVAEKGDWDFIRASVLGLDIDAAALERCEAEVVRTLAARGCPEAKAREIARGWLRRADFLLDPMPECDFVVGNPPYVRATEIDREKRALYCAALPSMTSGCDLYVGFFDRGLDILRPNGRLAFVCADRWLQNAYGRKLRRRVGSSFNLEALVRMHGVDAFEDDVDAYPAITLIRKEEPRGSIRFVNCASDFAKVDPERDARAVLDWLADPLNGKSDLKTDRKADLKADHFEAFALDRPEGDAVYPLGNSELVEFVTRARAVLPDVEAAGIRLGIGIATGCDAVFVTDNPQLVEPDRLLPLFLMRDHRQGRGERGLWLVNPWTIKDGQAELVDLECFPRLKAYFEAHRERLCMRHVAKRNPAAWYRTIDKPTPGLLERELLLMPDMAADPDPVLSRGKYPHHNTYWISSDTWDLRVLGGFLMADTTRRFVDALGVKMRGGTLRFQAQYLRLLRLPPYETLGDDVRAGLRRAFDEKNREAATHWAEVAYERAFKAAANEAVKQLGVKSHEPL